ncbi:MAG: hypothetical protein MUE69_32645 [Myxococcota bacterium]|jgi:hypothetical protein|nr:hypothetical protein [Myxococcota bacterium]
MASTDPRSPSDVPIDPADPRSPLAHEAERRARRVYELARIRRAVLAASPILALATVAALVSPSPTRVVPFALLSFGAAALMVWQSRSMSRAALVGMLAGTVPLALSLAANQWHACGPHGCASHGFSSFCAPACAVGGLVAGLGVGLASPRTRGAAPFWIGASGLAWGVGALGCACVGAVGVVGLAVGLLAGVMPAWSVRTARA